MSQRLDCENELVTSTTDGLLLFWDCDEVDPVQAIDVGSHQKLSCVRISPSGRYSIFVPKKGLGFRAVLIRFGAGTWPWAAKTVP
jgi:hypothetical protein